MSTIKTISGFYGTKNANEIERISDNPKAVFHKLFLYPCKGVNSANGKLNANAGNVYIGERTEGESDVTPDLLQSADLPIVIELPQGKNKLLRDVLIQADNAGDGVYFKGWEA